MEHARDIELIELVAQRLDIERRKAILAHLPECPACRAKLEAFTATWDLLGAWQVQPAGRGVSAQALSSGSAGKGAGSIVRFLGIRTAVRLAAAIAVVALGGYWSGRWSVRPVTTAPAPQPPQYVSILGLEIGESLSPLVLGEVAYSEQEG